MNNYAAMNGMQGMGQMGQAMAQRPAPQGMGRPMPPAGMAQMAQARPAMMGPAGMGAPHPMGQYAAMSGFGQPNPQMGGQMPGGGGAMMFHPQASLAQVQQAQQYPPGTFVRAGVGPAQASQGGQTQGAGSGQSPQFRPQLQTRL